ncbi:ABC-three component system middle component 6 [Megamonas funiformis]|uniref:ABC-three component system middle component 6 n=1 Tax=Megamonas funiformis TaxID=437897 RepID=UPI00294305C5|nr:ABC-three component system middle component 6 [Megamonas funiformis]
MILPKKHLTLYESFFGFGAFLLQYLDKPKTVDDLWSSYKKSIDNNEYPIKFSFDEFILTLDYLYIINAINKDEKGLLYI